MRNAFSLVELSIVLVILGLLTGGILAGQSLIRASELRSVGTEYNRYLTATHAFRDKYFYLPGDLPNAQSFWGIAHATPSICAVTQGTGTQTCNGDGDGLIENDATSSNEAYRYWQHLAQAGLVEGSYTGIGYSGSFWNSALNINIPPSRWPASGWTPGLGYPIGLPSFFAGTYGSNKFWFGKTGDSMTGYTTGRAMKQEDAWNIDTKLDDGKPATGIIRTFSNTQRWDCADTDTTAAVYQVSLNSVGCVLILDLK